MKRAELKKEYSKAETEIEKNLLFERFWNTNPRVRFWIYSLIIIVALLVLWVGIGLFIKLVRFIAF